MLNALGRLAGRAGVQLRGKPIHTLVYHPELSVLSDLEAANSARNRFSPDERLIVHAPEVFNPNDKYWKAAYFAPEEVAHAMGTLYKERSAVESAVDLTELEQLVEETMARREEQQTRMQSISTQYQQAEQNPAQLREFISSVLTGQFEFPEHLARELYQNAAAATATIPNAQIDITVDKEARIFRVEDTGTGMTAETLDGVYFNLFKSLNEYLEHAAGKFGMGAVSAFGAGHETVTVDTKAIEGGGGLVVVDNNLQRDDIEPTNRTEYGTSVEIQFPEDTDINFDRFVDIIKEDCTYNSTTPIYLHTENGTSKINQPLLTEENGARIIDTDRIQGHIRRSETGKLHILNHEIRLASIDVPGLEGVVNSDELDPVWSRDTIIDDPVLQYVIAYTLEEAKKLGHGGETDLSRLNLSTRLSDYNRFINSTLLNPDGTPNEQWIADHFADFLRSQRDERNAFESNFEKSLFPRAMAGIAKLYSRGVSSIVGKFKDDDWDDYKVQEYAIPITALGALAAGPVTMIAGAASGSEPLAAAGAAEFGGVVGVGLVTAAEGAIEGYARTRIQNAKDSFVEGIVDHHSEDGGVYGVPSHIGSAVSAVADVIPTNYSEYAGNLTDAQWETVGEVSSILAQYGIDGIEVFYADQLRETDPHFVVKPDQIALNPTVEFAPWAVVASYAARELEDLDTAREILEAAA